MYSIKASLLTVAVFLLGLVALVVLHEEPRQVDPQKVRARDLLAVAKDHLLLSQDDCALEEFDQAIACDSRCYAALYFRGVILEKRNEINAAFESYDKVQMGDMFYLAAAGRARIHQKRYESEEAESIFGVAINAAPSKAFAPFYERGLFYLFSLEDEKAFEDFSSAIEHSVNRDHVTRSFLERAKLFVKRGEKERAVDDLTHVIDMDASFYEARCLRATEYLALGQYDQALRDVQSVPRTSSHRAEAMYLRGCIHAAANQHGMAVYAFSMLLRETEVFADAFARRAQSNATLGKIEEAAEDFDNALILDPENEIALKALE